MLASNNNQYGLYLTPEDMQNSALMEQLRLQQEAQLLQAQAYQKQQYSYGWADPNTWHQPHVNFKEIVKKAPKIKLYHWLIFANIFALLIVVIWRITI